MYGNFINKNGGVSAKMIIGIGVDTVDVSRFADLLERTPRLKERLFTEPERTLPPRSLAARFAAKEAIIKAFGGSDDISWQDLEILKDGSSRPQFSNTPGLRAKLNKLAASNPHLSMTHDGNIATAFVVLETDHEPGHKADDVMLAQE